MGGGDNGIYKKKSTGVGRFWKRRKTHQTPDVKLNRPDMVSEITLDNLRTYKGNPYTPTRPVKKTTVFREFNFPVSTPIASQSNERTVQSNYSPEHVHQVGKNNEIKNLFNINNGNSKDYSDGEQELFLFYKKLKKQRQIKRNVSFEEFLCVNLNKC